ncbi:MAG TPA: enoyl-CoA hydratase-related protein [Actinomycetes bacterium]|nr:enoyl-CoA hydratase-related protein [Actinomycetes bacterium]
MSGPGGAERVVLRHAGGATWITIDRPDALNALDPETKAALLAALEDAADDPAVRVVALTGGGRAFCVGEDLRALEAGYRDGRAADLAATLDSFYAPAVRLLAEMPKPTVACVNGVAAGAGASLAFACDLRLASAAASFTLAFSGVGLIPDAGATWHLPRLVGLARALELALLGDRLGAEDARRAGLVSRVWPAEEFGARAEETVARLAAGPTTALALAKQLLRASHTAALDTALAAEARAQAAAGATADHLEGVAAFLAKRAPEFTGQ